MPLEDRDRVPHELVACSRPDVVHPQPDGNEAYAGPPLDDLLPSCVRLVDDGREDRLGSLQLTPVEESRRELDLHFPPRATVLRDQARGALEQRDRSGCVAASRRPLTGRAQTSGGTRGVLRALVDPSKLGGVSVSLLEVVAQELVELDELSAALREPLREAPVKIRAGRLRERLVRGVPDQEMPEPEPVVAGELSPVGTDQILAGQHRQARRDLCLLRCERLHGAAVEQLPFDRAALEHRTLGRLELVETGREERAQRRRDVDVVGLSGHCEHLRQEERVAARGPGNPVPQLERQPRDQLFGRFRDQRLEPESDRPVGALREQLRPRHAHEQDRRSRGEQRHPLDELQEGLLAPLDVVEDDGERSLLLEQLPERPGDLLGRGSRHRSPRSTTGAQPPRPGRRAGAASCLITSTTGQYVMPCP